MKKIKISILTLALLCMSLIGYSQNKKGTITKEVLQEIKKYHKNDASTRAITNAISNNSIKKLAINRENVGKIDTYFSDKVKTKGITNQKQSGRCWLFASLNVMRPKVIEKYNLSDFNFSQNYSFFWDQIEKANLFLEGIISTKDKGLDDRTVDWLFKSPVNDGGVWNDFTNITEKYGLVPQSVMPETNSSNSTSTMSRLLKRKLREDGLILRELNKKNKSLKDLRKEKVKMLGEIYHILAINLGEPPTKFIWRYKDVNDSISEPKEYTPLSFYKEAVGVDLKEYVLLMNDPSREYYKLYEIQFDRNVQEGVNWLYINLPNKAIKEFAIKSIKDNEAMYFSCDVGKQLDRQKGYLDVNYYDYNDLLGVDFNMNKKQRIITHESGSSHGMTLVGVDLDKDNNINKWLLENSWGMSGFKGHLIMTDKWFDEYMFRVVVNKKYVSKDVLKILKQKPILLPPWDPMFDADL
ncbi:MAG: C1 family peptidase [Bacteroidales bacterium]|nr:C1 family peptidase [Bacteroidales bacterium]